MWSVKQQYVRGYRTIYDVARALLALWLRYRPDIAIILKVIYCSLPVLVS